MGYTLSGMCESCLMPFAKDPQGAEREHEQYCSHCFSGGKLCYEGTDYAGFRRAMITAMTARGESVWKARLFAFSARFAPRWKRR